jgi:hypothetical protein
MTEAVAASASIVERALSGQHRELTLLAADGILPIPQEELIDVLVQLAAHEDVEVAERSRKTLGRFDKRQVATLLRQPTSRTVLEHFARHEPHPAIREVVLQRRDLPVELALELAPQLSAEAQEILLLRQDLIVDNPEILSTLEKNPSLSSYTKRRIGEYRQHLLGGLPAPEETASGLTAEQLFDEPSDAELQAQIANVMSTVAPSGDLDQGTGLTEAQIRALTIPARMKLAKGASRPLRAILVKDPNPRVACTVLTQSGVSEQEIEHIAGSRAVIEDVLLLISNRREWVGKYNVMTNLVRNPRTPVAVAMRLLPRLSVRDLGFLRRDRNVADTVRSTAARMYMAKSK